jgi:hypothetical protein
MSLKNQQLIQIYQFQQSTPFQHDKALMHRLGAFIITQCFKPEANDSNKEMKTDKLQTQIKTQYIILDETKTQSYWQQQFNIFH